MAGSRQERALKSPPEPAPEWARAATRTLPAATPDGGNYRITAAELRQFIERWERLDSEKKDIGEQQKEVMAEAKGRGYDTKVMKKVIDLRKRDRDDIAEEEAILDMYKEAMGM